MRFKTTLDSVIESPPNKNIAVVTHGTVMSLYVGRAAGVDAYEFRQQLSLPSFAVLLPPELRLLETVESDG